MSERQPLSAESVAEALRLASEAVFPITGGEAIVRLPADFPARRKLFHGLGDDERRALLLRLIREEGDRLAHDAGASFAPRARNVAGPLPVRERGGAAPARVASVARLARGNAPRDQAPEDAP